MTVTLFCLIRQLHSIMNAVSGVLTRTRKTEHISAAMRSFLWLPSICSIYFKWSSPPRDQWLILMDLTHQTFHIFLWQNHPNPVSQWIMQVLLDVHPQNWCTDKIHTIMQPNDFSNVHFSGQIWQCMCKLEQPFWSQRDMDICLTLTVTDFDRIVGHL